MYVCMYSYVSCIILNDFLSHSIIPSDAPLRCSPAPINQSHFTHQKLERAKNVIIYIEIQQTLMSRIQKYIKNTLLKIYQNFQTIQIIDLP